MSTLTSTAIHSVIRAAVSAVYQEVSGLPDETFRFSEETIRHLPPVEYIHEVLQGTYANLADAGTRLDTTRAQNSFRTNWTAVAEHVREEVLFFIFRNDDRIIPSRSS